MGKINTRTCKGLLSLMLISTAFASCTHESEDLNNFSGKNLKVSFNVAEVQSRAIFNEASLPTASVVGAKLDGYDSYSAITFTANGTGQSQTWTPSTDVVLGEDQGTLYTYFPHSQNTDISAIPVDMTAADQTDWLYGTPVTGVSEDNANVTVTLNHALANINLTLAKGSYVGTGNVTAISVKSDGIAPKGTFNAAQETPGYSALKDEGTAIERTVTTTLGGTATDIMVVPTGQSAAITFNVTVDGTAYTATSAAVQLEMGSSYKYTLTLNSTMMGVSEVAVTQWNPLTKENLTLEKVQANANTGPAINSAGKANGVYAVTATGELIAYNDAAVDATCLGVALITDNQRIMIEKMGEANTTSIKAAYDADGATNTGYTYFYWGMYGSDNSGITNYTKADGTNSSGYLGGTFTPQISTDFTTWTSGALSDFNGKANTAAIQSASDTDSYTTYANMGTYCTKFNATAAENQGFTDWYIPAYGQLALIYLNKTAINEALTAIGGTTFSGNDYWSSSEYNSDYGWYVNFVNGLVYYYGKYSNYRVRFVRDI